MQALNNKTPEKKVKPQRTEEETRKMKEQFFAAVNSYNIGEVNDDHLTKINNYVVQGDGIYLVINNAIGQFITKINEQEFPGLPSQFNGNRIKLNVPKMPSKIYHQIKNFFTDISEDMGEAEAFVQVYYDKQEDDYLVVVPKQIVSKASVQYDATENLNNTEPGRYVFVFEIHSHNTMGAFWSGTDNADEKDTRFYGVLGKLDNQEIEERYRYMVQGREVSLTKEHIFDFTEDLSVNKDKLVELINEKPELTIDDVEQLIYEGREAKIEYPSDWIKNISKQGVRSYSGTHNHGFTPQHSGFKTWQETQEEKEWNKSFNKPKPKYGKQMSMFGEEWDDEAEDMPSWMKDDPDYAMIQEVMDSFDLTELATEDELEAALDSIATTIEPVQVSLLIEKLVDMGHHNQITDVVR